MFVLFCFSMIQSSHLDFDKKVLGQVLQACIINIVGN